MTTPPIATAPPSGFGHHIKQISHQSSVFLIGTLFSTAVGYFFKIYLARTLGAEALGVYALGMTVVGMASILSAFGLPQAASRFVAVFSAKGEARRLGQFLWSASAMLVLANLVVGLFVLGIKRWISGTLYHTPPLSSYMFFFVLIMLTGALTTFLGQALAGFKDVAKRTVITNFISPPVTIALSVALIALGLGLEGYLVAQIASAAVGIILLARTVWKLSPADARNPSLAQPRLEREVVSFSLALFGVQTLEFLLGQADKVLMGIYLHAREVGIYSIAAALIAFVPLALQSVNQIFSPTIAELHAKGEQELLARLFRSLAKWTLGLTLPLAMVMILFARPIMGMFGPDFEAGYPVLIAGTVGQLVNSGVGSVGYLLLMSGHQKKLLRIQVVMAAVLVGANMALIPIAGMLGAALAGAAINAISNLWYLAEVRRSLRIRLAWQKYIALAIPGAATAAALWVFRRFLVTAWPSWVQVVSALAIGYLLFLGASLLTLDADDRVIATTVKRKILGFAGAALRTVL